MRTFGTDVDNLILEEYHAGINRYNVILYHNGKKIDPYIKKLTVHFMGNPVPFGNISKHYFELNTDYMDFLEKDEVEIRIEKNSVEIKVCTFYIKTINKGEYMASYTAFSSLLEPEKIALYKIDEDPEWRVAWNNSAKTIKEILDIFLKPANLAMAEYPSYDGTFVSLHADWENMTLSQLICACGILEGCNYVLIGNTFYPVRPSKAVAKSYDIGECVYSENLWQRKTDLCCGKLDVGIKVWEYENYTSEDPLMGSVVSFMESSIEYNNPSSGTGVISANFPLIPGENSSKIKEYMISKLSPFIGMDMNSYTIEYLGDAFIEPGDKVKFYDDSRLVQFYPSEIIWEWDGGLRCTLKSEIVQESGTTEAEVSLKEIVNTINSVANTLQNVRYNSVTTKTLEADAANIGLLKAEQADIKYATIQSLNATDAKITALDSATIKTDELYSKVADLDYIKSDHADIAVIKNTMITTDTLKTEIAKIGYLTTDEADIRYLTVSTADTKYLHADMSDMDIAKIQTLFATAGIVSDMTIKDGHITGVLDSVTVNANRITTGTLSVDRLVIRGSEKSLVYELNNISGALQAKSVDTLNGEILTQRTITADKLVAKSITSNEIKAGTITSDEIAANSVTADKLSVDAITSRNYVANSVGMKLNLADGSWESKYTKIDKNGKIRCSNIIISGGEIELISTKNTPYFRLISKDAAGNLESSSFYNSNGFFIAKGDSELEGSASMAVSSDPDLSLEGKYSRASYSSMGLSLYLPGAADADYTIRLTATTGNIDVVGDVTTSSGASLNTLKTDLSSLSTTVSGLSTSVSSLSTTVSGLSTSLSALQTNVNTYYQPFGSSGASLKSGQNLNEFYSGVILGAGMGNAPNGDWWLVVSGGTGGTTVQRAYNLWNGQCYYRYCASGNWSGWSGTLNCGDITGTGAITISNGNMTSAGVITNALRMPTRAGTQTTAKPNCYIDSNGNFYKTSTASSKGVKDNVKLLENEDLNPSKLYDVNIYQFKYKSAYLSNKEDVRYQQDMIGFTLEDLFNKYPIAVDCHMDEAGKIIYDSWNEQYLIPAMLKLIQDQHKELINQSMKIQNLENRLLFMNA